MEASNSGLHSLNVGGTDNSHLRNVNFCGTITWGAARFCDRMCVCVTVVCYKCDASYEIILDAFIFTTFNKNINWFSRAIKTPIIR